METFLAARAAHIADAEPGTQAARRLSELTDEAVRELARAASSHLGGRWAVLALGGWGFGGLLPQSDLDVLVLSDERPEVLKPFVESLLYPLWDAGLKVGHQVRSPKQQVRAMREDLKTLTAALTARPIAGDLAWATGAHQQWLSDARRHRRRALGTLRGRKRPGSPYLLEPNLKDGAGGRRDFDEIVWTAVLQCESGTDANEALAVSGLLDSDTRLALLADAELVARARWELQRDGAGDQLSVESAAGLSSVDPEQVQGALGRTSLALTQVRATAGHASLELRPPSASELLRTLGLGTAALDHLELLAQAGRLEDLMPGVRDLMACRRPGLGHDLTVGAHTLKTACLIAEPPPGDPMLTSSYASLGDERIPLIGALAHDYGKMVPGPGHAERGAQPGHELALRFGLEASQADAVASLVRNHLLLVETALYQDLDDEDTVLRCAAALNDRALVAPLHVVTAADARATGEGTWTSWSAALVGKLVSRLDAALSPEFDGAGMVGRAEEVRAQALEALAPDEQRARGFVSHAPLRYLASRPPDDVARHARLVADFVEVPSRQTKALLAVGAGPAEATHLLTFVTAEGRELLSRLSGAIALAGLDILSVDAYRMMPDVALHTFVVTSATARPAGPETFTRLERLTEAALRDRLDLAVRLRERRAHYPMRANGSPAVATEHRGPTTELRVNATDRVGLLHDVAAAVAASELDVVWAKARTVDGVARDVFHVVGPDGGPVDDPGVLGHLMMRLREVLA